MITVAMPTCNRKINKLGLTRMKKSLSIPMEERELHITNVARYTASYPTTCIVRYINIIQTKMLYI